MIGKIGDFTKVRFKKNAKCVVFDDYSYLCKGFNIRRYTFLIWGAQCLVY
ncbi:hypothetical protein [uncultured Gammaproteobacteria bacterium]|nr:hypothetical protein BROOK1789B_2050 [Bathymodiolus brooksi thiotrophic gill symbiont]CAC9560868.1 hypothetical protein [uncultured Gammaproteobacteria bacterium]CAC9562605.1 hypothetical protein [uncultured Gammaproteobacteria bacterium]CAC9582180.1 hypothetical protein [uncultured Gammaproteobacteria bacterium]CAC9604630.1 hypothetical protein [uncultured Gammaproteobacteria bacterium]